MTPAFNLQVLHREEDASTEHLRPLFEAAWDEFIELKCMPKREWIAAQLALLEESSRIEIQVWDGASIAGVCIVSDDWDVHVGPCMSVLVNYVLPEYRQYRPGTALFRGALRIAREMRFPAFAWTHRVGDWHYSTRYRRLTYETQEVQ